MKFKKLICLLGLSMAIAGLALPVWADKGTVVRQTELRQNPFADAPSVGPIDPGTVVEIQKNQGAWLQVKSATAQGWVKLLNVRTSSNDTRTSPASASVTTLAGMLVSSVKGNAVTTGVKGLTAENIEAKEPNYNEIDRINLFTIEPAMAAQTAQAVELKPVDVPAIVLRAEQKPEIAAAASK